MKFVRLLLAVLVATSPLAIGAKAQEPERLSYGSRAGMDVMVLDKSGIGTSKAIIKIKMTRENAAEFCELYLGDMSAGCAKKVLKQDGSRIRPTVSGNCKTGIFTDMYGYSYAFKGQNKNKTGEDMADFLIVNRKTGEILDGSMASGYGVAIAVFEALCPKFKAVSFNDTSSEQAAPKANSENTSIARGPTDAETAQIEALIANAPSPDGLEMISGTSLPTSWDECLSNFESNLYYSESGFRQIASLIDDKNHIGYQSMLNEEGDSILEARCAGGNYVMAIFKIIPYKK